MKRSSKILLVALAATLVALTLAWAQPGGGRRGGGASGMSAEQLFGYLALSPDIMLRDEQLLNVRNALRGSYRTQVELSATMGSGAGADPETQKRMAELQQSMVATVSGSLTKVQNNALKGMMAQAGRGRRGGRGR
ncbi:MAG TPA: hypothetical protein DIC52_01115 [Candidatus Latescibacteria bacterium]|nr:hypothetical protein [Candidatus Latescibacterota bacterium]